MKDEQIKIQPGDDADDKAGQSQEVATDDKLSDITAEKFAGMSDEEKLALMDNVKKMRAEATQKFQEASEYRKQFENLQAEREYYKTEAQKRQEVLDKYYESLTSQQQPARSEPLRQPPKIDPYATPEQIAKEYTEYYNSLRAEDQKALEDIKKELESVKEETNTGMRTLRIEKYLEKAIPKVGPDVSQEEIEIWARQHPDADWTDRGWMNTLNQAIRERQAIYDQKVQAKYEEYLKEKEAAAKKAQETPGAPFAGGTPDFDKFAKMTPAEQEAEIAKYFAKGGGG